MSGWLYGVLIGASRYVGIWVIRVFAWIISSGYFVFFPRRVKNSMRFYRALFPERGWFYRLGLTWRQFHRFAGLFAERIRLERGGAVERIDEGFERIEQAASEGKGGILLMSHVGIWEVAARLFTGEGLKLMLFMGERQQERVEKMQKADLQQGGVEVVVASADGAAAFSPLEGLRFIEQGGVVSFAGDRLWTATQRSVAVRFLGHRVEIPAGPHLFALATGAPIFTFFALGVRRRRYHLVAFGPRSVEAASRADRWPAVERSAQEYVDMLSVVVRRFPTHWFHFEPFLGEPWRAGPSD